MHTIVHRQKPTRRPRATASTPATVRSPHFDCRQQAGAMQLVVYVPGVEAAGVEITVCGPDLTVTARKTRFVRTNWTALQLEKAQHDYELRLRLGYGYDYDALLADIRDGVLTLTLPEKDSSSRTTAEHLARVA